MNCQVGLGLGLKFSPTHTTTTVNLPEKIVACDDGRAGIHALTPTEYIRQDIKLKQSCRIDIDMTGNGKTKRILPHSTP
jgi:hypothetical protein